MHKFVRQGQEGDHGRLSLGSPALTLYPVVAYRAAYNGSMARVQRT